MTLQCLPWSSSVEPEALAFLQERFATSLFLLGNREDQGSSLTDHPNSGNFRVLRGSAGVEAVFVHTRRGNVLVSGNPSPEAFRLIEQACLAEALPLQGVLGNWELSKGLWDHFQARGVIQSCSFHSREILYSLGAIPESPPEAGIRFLRESDYSQWRPIRKAYSEEEGILHELPEEQLRANFARYCGMKEYWGTFEGERLVATAALNARALDIGQVGGVYTVPELRGKGFSQRLMRQLLRDCALVHGLKRMVLFTGEKNLPAQRVYEKVGFRRIGHFGIFFI